MTKPKFTGLGVKKLIGDGITAMEHLQNIIIGFGYIGVTLTIFAESGLFFGAFLPGDSLLFTLGLLASRGDFNILILWILATTAAILGDNVGYAFGKYVGNRFFTKEDTLVFRRSHVIRAQRFYERHGKKAIVLARFVPIIRTFAPIVAGIGHMHYPTFFLFNVLGGVLWTTSLLGLGYGVGNLIPGVDRYIEWIIMGIIVLSVLPLLFEFLRERRKTKQPPTSQ